jgi:hypothetical protein
MPHINIEYLKDGNMILLHLGQNRTSIMFCIPPPHFVVGVNWGAVTSQDISFVLMFVLI